MAPNETDGPLAPTLPFWGALLGAGAVLVAALVGGGLFSKLPWLLLSVISGAGLGRLTQVVLEVPVPEPLPATEEATHESA